MKNSTSIATLVRNKSLPTLQWPDDGIQDPQKHLDKILPQLSLNLLKLDSVVFSV